MYLTAQRTVLAPNFKKIPGRYVVPKEPLFVASDAVPSLYVKGSICNGDKYLLKR